MPGSIQSSKVRSSVQDCSLSEMFFMLTSSCELTGRRQVLHTRSGGALEGMKEVSRVVACVCVCSMSGERCDGVCGGCPIVSDGLPNLHVQLHVHICSTQQPITIGIRGSAVAMVLGGCGCTNSTTILYGHVLLTPPCFADSASLAPNYVQLSSVWIRQTSHRPSTST